MKKRILAGALIATLLPHGLSASRGEALLEALRNARGFTSETAQFGRELLTGRNLALFGSAFYIGLPVLQGLKDRAQQLLERGKTKGYGIGKLSKLIAAIFSFPAWLRTKLSGRTATNPVPPVQVPDINPLLNRIGNVEKDITLLGTMHKGTSEKVGNIELQQKELGGAIKNHFHNGYASIKHGHDDHALLNHDHTEYVKIDNLTEYNERLTNLSNRVIKLETNSNSLVQSQIVPTPTVEEKKDK